MNQDTIFNWDCETGITECILTDGKGNTFYGSAKCHPEDRDMMNEHTGYEIAYQRAFLNALRFYRDNELKNKYASLKHFYHVINHSKHFNEHSYEVKMLKRQMHMFEEDLETIKTIINDTKQRLLEYIAQKNDFYIKIRNNREVKRLEEEHKNF